MNEALIWVGLGLVILGAVVFLLPMPSSPPAPGTENVDIAKILEELNKLLDKFDKRYRPGIVLMSVGLTLIGLGIYMETKDAAEQVKEAAAVLTVFRS